jgi:hypothetical protein
LQAAIKMRPGMHTSQEKRLFLGFTVVFIELTELLVWSQSEERSLKNNQNTNQSGNNQSCSQHRRHRIEYCLQSERL